MSIYNPIFNDFYPPFTYTLDVKMPFSRMGPHLEDQ